MGTDLGWPPAFRPLRALAIGVLAGGGAAAVVAGVFGFSVWLAVTTGLIDPVAGPRPRIPHFIVACALAGALPGTLGPRIRTPGLAALLGAATAIGATGIHRLLDPGADPAPTSGAARALAQLFMPGLIGLAAPVVWAPLRAAAARSTGRAVVEIAARVGALVLGLLSALMAAPAVFFGGLGLIAGLVRLSAYGLLVGLAHTATALALIGASCVCLWLAGVPRGSGPLPGFEPRPDRAGA